MDAKQVGVHQDRKEIRLDFDYSKVELINGLKKVGLERGDTVFLHISHRTLGKPQDCTSALQESQFLLGAIQEALGPNGTILVPTYTFSFTRQEVFDLQNTPSPGGPWSTSVDFLEYVRKQPGVIRSRDPIHSVAGLGPKAHELLTDVPNTCFGKGSVHHRLKEADGKICTIGVGLHEASFRHHVEETVGVPFRFNKLFTGLIRENGELKKQGWLYFVRIMADSGFPAGERLEERARDLGLCCVARVGKGEITAISCREFFDFASHEIRNDPWLTAKGPAGDPIALENSKLGCSKPQLSLPSNASMMEMIDSLWRLPRDIVSDGYDAALEALATQLPMTIHKYPTGTECWSWIIPEKWTCHEAYLETMDGRRLFSYAENPLHVVSYSLPFDGEVSRDELLKHLSVHPRLPDAIPFIFKYYERDWGLCCSKSVRDSLTDSRYRVVIRTSFSYGALSVGEVVARGKQSESIVLCAHLCHPAMVNDDLTGIVVGMKVMDELLKRKDLRYTYRFLIVPETIGSLAYLSHNEDLIPSMKGGLFLEMLGRDHPHALQLSFDGSTEIDHCFTRAMNSVDPKSWTGPYRTIIGNDERQFNGPGVRVPMLSLSRVLRPSAPEWPYREYHSSEDTPERVSVTALEESKNLVLKMIDAFEKNPVPVNRFKGEVFCSRFGVHIDAYENPEGNRALFDILDLIDGTRSIEAIAERCGISADAAKRTVEELRRHGVVEF